MSDVPQCDAMTEALAVSLIFAASMAVGAITFALGAWIAGRR